MSGFTDRLGRWSDTATEVHLIRSKTLSFFVEFLSPSVGDVLWGPVGFDGSPPRHVLGGGDVLIGLRRVSGERGRDQDLSENDLKGIFDGALTLEGLSRTLLGNLFGGLERQTHRFGHL
jgi:hypothetical protein